MAPINIIERILNDHTLVLELDSDDLCFQSAPYVYKQLEERYTKLSFKNIIIDLKKVNHIDSAGIGLLITFYKSLEAKKITFYIANSNPPVNKVLHVTQADSIFRFISPDQFDSL